MDLKAIGWRAPPELEAILRRLRGAGHEAWLVGGAVRDLLLGRALHEYDLATDARAEEVAALFPKVVETGVAHGTVTVVQGGLPVEVTTFRGVEPTIEADLARRDLTVNAMAFDPIDGRFLDPHGGRTDLQRCLVRTVGDPAARFDEDPLRTMRAVRFASVLGFRLDRSTRHAIRPFFDRFARVAVERIRSELSKILVGDHPRYGIELLRRTGLLRGVVPELLEGFGLRQNRWHRYDVYHHVLRAVDAAPPVLVVRLATLLHDIDKPRSAAPSAKGEGDLSFHGHELSGADRAKEICERLRYPTKVCEEVALLVREHQFVYSDAWSDGAVRRVMARVGPALDHLLALREADVRGRGWTVEEGLENARALEARVRALQQKALALTIKDLAIGGRDVMDALGIGPSPVVGEAMGMLLGAVLEDPARNTREELLALLARWWSERQEGSGK